MRNIRGSWMKRRIVSLGVGLILVFMALNIPVSAAQEIKDVESGLGGITDFGTNLGNLKALLMYVKDNFSLSMDWIKGIMGFMENFPDNAGLAAGLYLSLIGLLAPVIIMIVMMAIVIPISMILGMTMILMPLSLILSLGMMMISVIVCIIFGIVGVIGGYFVFANSGEGLMHIAGILQIAGSAISMVPLIGILGLIGVLISVIMQLLGILGVI